MHNGVPHRPRYEFGESVVVNMRTRTSQRGFVITAVIAPNWEVLRIFFQTYKRNANSLLRSTRGIGLQTVISLDHHQRRVFLACCNYSIR